MSHFYNEIDGYAAAWMRNLQANAELPAGTVDERSIEDVQAADLQGFTQAHFFAGIGGWPLALRLAGWPEGRPVWTGSCPCQPFSGARGGQSEGLGDKRHLWPSFRRLISECRPPVVFGEQVASEDGRYWLAGVRVELEQLGYAVGAADLCAAGVGAPHVRQRLFWVADANGFGRGRQGPWKPDPDQERYLEAQKQGRIAVLRSAGPSMQSPWPPGPCCVDKIPRLADGIPGQLGGIRAFGNAIVPEAAAAFVGAYLDVHDSSESRREQR